MKWPWDKRVEWTLPELMVYHEEVGGRDDCDHLWRESRPRATRLDSWASWASRCMACGRIFGGWQEDVDEDPT